MTTAEQTGLKIKLGFAGLGRIQFDIDHARQEFKASRKTLLEIPGVDLVPVEELSTTPREAETAARQLKQAGVELLVVQLATFTDASLVTALFAELDLPVILWALPEPSIGEGGRLRLNSLCGVNLAAYTLGSTGRRYSYIYGSPEEPRIGETLRMRVASFTLNKIMRNLKLGVVGSRPPGFFPSGYDELKLWKEIGPQIQIYNLSEVFGTAQALALEKSEPVREQLRACLNGLDEMPEQIICTASNTYTALKELADREGLGALAVKCWPEFFTEHGAAACGVLAALAENGLVAACEADVHGAVTMKAANFFSQQPPFLADLVALDRERDTIVLWHCGNAAFSLAAVPEEREAGVHANRKVGVTAMFPLKPGRITLSRLSYSQGKYRLLLLTGEALNSPLLFQGNTAEVRPDCGAEKLLDTIIYGGFEHHTVMSYGDISPQLADWAGLIGLEVVRL